MASTTAQIEDKILAALTDTAAFRSVTSIGRNELPKTRVYPFAWTHYDGFAEIAADTDRRPQLRHTFVVLVGNEHKRGQGEAARDTSDLIDSARDAVNGQRLTLTDISPFRVRAVSLLPYDEGSPAEIIYAITCECVQTLPVLDFT